LYLCYFVSTNLNYIAVIECYIRKYNITHIYIIKSGEFQLPDALRRLTEAGNKFKPGKVDEWLDCGNKEVTVFTNQRVLEYDYAKNNYYTQKGIYGTTHFGCWTPEMTISFLSDERIQNLARNKFPGRLGSESSKHYVYNRHSNFNLIVRKKYSGYEQLVKSNIWQHPILKEIEALDYNGYYSVDYFELIKSFV
jgi:hypothetical protein